MSTALAALLSHWRRSPLQLAMLLLGLALATALWSGVQAINAEARASYAQAAATLGQDRLSRIAAEGPVPQETYVALRRAGWRVSPVVEGRLRIDERRSLRLIGIDPLTLPAPARQVEFGEGDALLPFLTAPGLIFADPETLARMQGAELPPMRAAEGLPPGTGLMDIGQAQRLLGMEGRISHLLLDPAAPQPGPLPDGLRLIPPDSESDVARLTDSFHLNLTAFGLLSFAVGLFIVHSAIGLAFEQRRPMFRTLRALGVTARTLIGLLFAELLLFALLAGAAGLPARLSGGGAAAARCGGDPARPLRRRGAGHARLPPGMGRGRARDRASGHPRLLGPEPLARGPSAATGPRPAPRLGRGLRAGALAAGDGGGGPPDPRGRPPALGPGDRRGLRAARGAASGRSAPVARAARGPPAGGAGARTRAHRAVVLGRHAPAAARPLARADGAPPLRLRPISALAPWSRASG